MERGGWIKIHKKMLDSAVFDNPMLLKIWMWCLFRASYEEKDVVIGKQIVKLKPGQLIYGRLKAAEELKMADRTFYDYMKMLREMGMVTIKSNNKFSVATVVKWDIYQCQTTDSQQQTTQQITQQATHNKEYKRNKRNNNKFNDFPQREIDFQSLEMKLLKKS